MASETFTTSDISLATYLIMTGRQLTATERLHGGKFNFRFTDYRGREAELMRFFNRRITVEPNAFLDNLKSLKALLNQQ